jgi:1-acyl-sn-glycerol-3-phosphate acyltransferase
MNKLVSWFSQICLVPILKLLFIKEIKGEENIPNHNFILASNHQSHLDQIANGIVCAPREFYYIGQVDKYSGFEGFMRDFFYFLGGVIKLDRTSSKSKKEVLKKSIEILKKGKGSLVIYPEGTRTRTGEIGEGKWGVAKLLFESGTPILPVALDGAFELMPPGGKLKIEKRIKINIGKPLYFSEELEKVKNLEKNSEEYKQYLQKATNKIMKKIKQLKKEL